MRSVIPLASGHGYSAFALGPICVFLLAGELSVESTRASLVAIRRMTTHGQGRPSGMLIDYHGPLVLPGREVRTEVAAAVREAAEHLPAARSVVLRGTGLRHLAMRAFFRWALALTARSSATPDCPASDVPTALAFFARHLEAVPTLEELHSALIREYARVGLGAPDFEPTPPSRAIR